MSVWYWAPYLEPLNYHWENSLELLQVKIWAITKTLYRTENLRLKCCLLSQRLLLQVCGHQSFFNSKQTNKKTHCIATASIEIGEIFVIACSHKEVKSSLTCKWKIILEKHTGHVLPVKSSLGDPFFCFIHSFVTVPASQRQGHGKLKRAVELFGVCLHKNVLLH